MNYRTPRPSSSSTPRCSRYRLCQRNEATDLLPCLLAHPADL